MDIPFSLYIFRKSVKKVIDGATKLFDRSSTLKGQNYLNKLSNCTPSDIEEKPEYVNDLVQDLVTEMTEIKSKQTELLTLKSHKNSKRKIKCYKKISRKSRKSRKSSQKLT